MKKTGPVTFVSFAKGITYRIRGLIIRLHPNSPIFTCRLAILFSLVPAPSHLHTHKYRFPEDGDKKFQGSVRRRRVEYPSRNNYASVPRSSDRTRAVNYDPSRVVNGVLTIRLNVGRFERRMLVLPGFIFLFFFFISYTFFPAAIFPPLEEFSLSIHFARRICETRQYMRHRVTLRMSIRAFSIFLPCLSSSPCSIYSCIVFFLSFFFFGILIFLCEMRRHSVPFHCCKDCRGSITLVTIFLNRFQSFRECLLINIYYTILFMPQIHLCLSFMSLYRSLFLSLLSYRIRSLFSFPFYFPFSRNETIYL